MRRFLAAAALLALALPFAGAKDETVAELKARFESARPEDRPILAMHIAQRDLREADRLYGEGKSDDARAAVDDIVVYCQKARDAAIQSNKHLKTVEIDARKIADKLRDIRRTIAFEDQPPVEQAIRALEDVRTSLLKEMFRKPEKDKKK